MLRFLFIVFLCCYIVIVAATVSKLGLEVSKIRVAVMVAVLLIIGTTGFLLSKDIVTGNAEIVCIFIFTYSIAGLFLAGIMISLSDFFAVDTKVRGVYVGKRSLREGLFPVYRLIFDYIYNGKTYRQETFESVGRIASSGFKEGKEYDILISSKKPSVAAARRRIGAGTWCMIFMFLILLIVPLKYVGGMRL